MGTVILMPIILMGAYHCTVACLDVEVDEDLSTARAVLKTVQEQCLAVIVQAQREAVSVLLQVLYFLHQGHVQFLIGDYRARILNAVRGVPFPTIDLTIYHRLHAP